MDPRTLPTHPGTGLTAIGLLPDGRPIWPIAGAAEDPAEAGEGDGDEAADADDGEPDSEGEPEEAPADAWTPPSKEEWEANLAKLKRANDQAKRLREQMKAAGVNTGPKPTPAKAAPKPAPPKKATPAPVAEEPDEAPAVVVQDDGELERWQVRALRADAKSELIARGCDPKMVNLALGQLKPAEVDWDGDSPILEDWLDEMEEEYPALFAKPAAPTKALPRKAGSIDQGAAANGTPAEKPRPFGEALLKRGGWGRERSQGLANRRG